MSDFDSKPPPLEVPGFAAPDRVTTVTTTSWVGRVRDSVGGVLFGIVLVVASVVLLFWNEGNEITTLQTLDLAARLVIEAPPTSIDPALDGRLVHLTAPLAATAPARDPIFGVIAAGAVRLDRRVEMFQWEESSSSTTEKSVGGSSTTRTTYDYRKVWSDRAISSASFYASAGHENPPLPLPSLVSDAADVRLGPYRLDAAVLDNLGADTPAVLPESALLPPGWRRGPTGPYRGSDPASPSIGDVRVSFTIVPPGPTSVVAGQQGVRLGAFIAPNDQTVALATPGVASAHAMFNAERSRAKLLAWALRLGGFVLCLIGLVLLVRPLAVLVSLLPILETLVDVTATLVMAGVAALITLTTIAVARIYFQPLISLALVAAGVGIVWGCIRLRRRPAAVAQH